MSTSPSLLVREISPTGDPVWGNGQINFLTNKDAVAQLLATRLRLFQGEWWANLLDGLPLWQGILTVSTNVAAATRLLQTRIFGTFAVTGITNVASSFNSATRMFSFSADVQTQYGVVQVTFVQPVQ